MTVDGDATSEYQIIFYDVVGRPFLQGGGDGSAQSTFYNELGQMFKQQDPDGVITLYGYNARGEQDTTAMHVDSGLGDTIQWSGTDRITKTISDVLYDADVSTYVQRTRTYVWSVNSSATSNLVSTTEVSTNGLNRWQITWNKGVGMTNRSVTSYASGGYRYEYQYAVDHSYTYSVYQYGQLQSMARFDANDVSLLQTSYAYDVFGRLLTSTDARNGATTYAYNAAGLTTSVTTPAPGGGAAETTLTYYDSMGRTTNVVNPDGASVYTAYWPSGQTMRQWGARTYPVGYGYDYAGRILVMTNWSGFSAQSGARVTTWHYNTSNGRLSSKTYDDGNGPGYGYTLAGRLASRAWGRGVVSYYAYTAGGDLDNVTYGDGVTPQVNYGYDRRGRQQSLTQTFVDTSTAVCSLVYNDAGQVLSESYAGGPQDGWSVTNGYDQWLRRTNVVLLKSGVVMSNAFAYDAASRLAIVTDGTNAAAYSYVANSGLVGEIDFKQSGTLRMSTSKSYDHLNRLTGIQSANASSVVLDSHNYNYNPANQRTGATNSDGSYWVYQYDPLGQVTSGIKYWSDGSVVAGQQFGYGFDDIGNRQSTSAGGDEWGANLRYAHYSANNLNQYTSRTVPGAVDIIGSATNTATVTVNNQRTSRKGNYYRAQLLLDNSAGAVWPAVTNLAVLNEGTVDTRQSSVVNHTFLAQTPEAYTYDTDGNLTQDGRWNYTWDGENRLISMSGISGVPDAANLKLEFAYDSKGRRIQKTVSQWDTGTSAYIPQSTNRFVYDGWNLLAELNVDVSLKETFMWGSDLSGSMQGAGGVGGLLSVKQPGVLTNFVSYDGNGNVTALANASDATLTAIYEYGPFGEVIRATGPMAKLNPFRFSTKFQDDESDLLYYGYRYYMSSDGSWLSKDPIEERGGNTLYRLNANNCVNFIDINGLAIVDLAYAAYIETPYLTFAGRTFNGGLKTLDTVTVNTDTASLEHHVFVGHTIEYSYPGGPQIADGQASGSTIKASVVFRGNKGFKVEMDGDEQDPLIWPQAFTPGILYHVDIWFFTCEHRISWGGYHVRFPAHVFFVDGDEVHYFSAVAAGTSPLQLYSWQPKAYFKGESKF